jgi:1-acyl-sn-glycerol-3-phosphate acyltransferase
MIRTLFVYLFLGLAILLVLPWFVIWTVLTGNPDAMYSVAMRAFALATGAAGIRIRVDGLENIPPGVCVFISNHASNLDPMVFFPAIPRRISVLIKKELMRIPILATGMRIAKFVPVDRDDREAAGATVELAVRHLRDGLSFAIFAEGTRSPDGRIRPFKRGATLMALQARVPVVPVSIAGTQHLMRKGSRLIQPGDVAIHFGRAIDAAQFTLDRRDDLLGEVESEVVANLPPDQRPPE